MKNFYDVMMIGGGPAGVSAAVYCARGGLDVCILHDGSSALNKAERIQNYYGTGEIAGRDLYLVGIEQARSVGVDVVDGQAVFAAFDGDKFGVDVVAASDTIKEKNGKADVPSRTKIEAKRLVIATGARRATADIAGLAEYEGKGVSSCAVCDAFFYRNKRVAVLGAGEYAEHEYEALRLASERVLLTNGAKPSFSAPNTVTKRIVRVLGSADTGRLCAVEFEDGEVLDIDGLFVALGTLGASGLSKSLGILTDKKGAIVTDAHGMTNIQGLYAAGDCTAGVKQVARAVADGMNVGFALVADLKGDRRGEVNDG